MPNDNQRTGGLRRRLFASAAMAIAHVLCTALNNTLDPCSMSPQHVFEMHFYQSIIESSKRFGYISQLAATSSPREGLP